MKGPTGPLWLKPAEKATFGVPMNTGEKTVELLEYIDTITSFFYSQSQSAMTVYFMVHRFSIVFNTLYLCNSEFCSNVDLVK